MTEKDGTGNDDDVQLWNRLKYPDAVWIYTKSERMLKRRLVSPKTDDTILHQTYNFAKKRWETDH